jgi:putative flippase GtrA
MKLESALPRDLVTQVIRFGMVGGFVTALGAVVYWVPATFLGVHPLLANFFAYVVAAGVGYVLHSRVSFKGHGSRDNPARRTGRSFAVSIVSFLLNSFFVWLLTGLLHGPTWWPVVTMVCVTPLATFALYRYWVFA